MEETTVKKTFFDMDKASGLGKVIIGAAVGYLAKELAEDLFDKVVDKMKSTPEPTE